jgi:HEAT repeat protein
MIDVTTDYFLAFALRRLKTASPAEQKELVELLLLYRQLYSLSDATRAAVAQALLPLLASPDHSVRYWTARALGEYGSMAALPSLDFALKSETNESVKGWLRGAISRLSPTNVNRLQALFSSSDAQIRMWGAESAFFEADPKVRVLVANSLNDPDANVLSRKLLAVPGPQHMLHRAALITHSKIRPLRVPSTSNHLLFGLDLPDLLTNLITSGNQELAEFAIWNLALLRESSALPIVLKAIDPATWASARVREWAYKYLGFIAKPEFLPTLKLALDTETDAKAREGLAFAIGNIGTPAAIDLLTVMVAVEQSPAVRKWAVRAHSYLPLLPPSTVSAFSRLLEEDTDPEVIREIYSVFGRHKAVQPLLKLELTESHLNSEVFKDEVVLYLLGIVSQTRSEKRWVLTRQLMSEPVHGHPIIDIAHSLAHEMGVGGKVVPTQTTGAVDNYIRGRQSLTHALSLALTGDISSALSALRYAGLLMDHCINEMKAEPRQKNHAASLPPPYTHAQFYSRLCLAHEDIVSAINARLSSHFRESRSFFSKARSFFRLHSFDTGVPGSERMLCVAMSLWLDAQITLNQIEHGIVSNTKLNRAIQLLSAASARANDALRAAMASDLRSMRDDLVTLASTSLMDALFDSTSSLNKVVLGLPLIFSEPITADMLVQPVLTKSAVSADEIELTLNVTVNPVIVDQLPVDWQLVLRHISRIDLTEIDVLVLSSTQVSKSQELYSSTVKIDSKALQGGGAQSLQPLLRSTFFEVPSGPPIPLPPELISVQASVLPSPLQLRKQIAAKYNLDGVRTLCFHLNVEYDDLGGEGRSGKIRELIKYMDRANRYRELCNFVSRPADR